MKCICGGVILADTEDWENPRCYQCLFKTREQLKQFILQTTIRAGELAELAAQRRLTRHESIEHDMCMGDLKVWKPKFEKITEVLLMEGE